MATLPKVCRCGRVVKGVCQSCTAIVQARAEDYRPSKRERYGSHWTALSQHYRSKHPLCEQCMVEGRTTAATEVHHKIKAKDRPDLILQWDNLMSVCRSCHEKLERDC